MKSAKRFVLTLIGVYFVVWVVMVALLGPAGHSRAYLRQFGVEHEHYLEIIKSDAYKLHQENPGLHPADAHLQHQMAFVEAYKARPEFQAEERRRGLFNGIFDVINAAAVVILAVRFGRAPLLNFLDEKIADLRRAVDRATQSREEAARRKAAAQAQIAGLDEERRRIEAQAAELIEAERRQIQESTEQALAQIARETEDRKQLEERQAARRIKRELAEQAIKTFVRAYRAAASPQQEAPLIDQFVRGVTQGDGHRRNEGRPV